MFENHVGFWYWQAGVVVYRVLKPGFAKAPVSSLAATMRWVRVGVLALEIGLASVHVLTSLFGS
jgi:hypothetical protein